MKNDRMFPTFYKVNFWDGEQMVKMQGMLFASTYAEAMEKLTYYYGDADINAIEITMAEENYLFETMDQELWRKMLHEAGGTEAFAE